MFKIDSRGDISAHLEDYIQAFEAYSAAICLDVADDGMLPFYLHLSDAELQLRHPNTIRTPPIQKPVRPLDGDPLFKNKLALFKLDEEIYKSYRIGCILLITAFYDYLTDDLKTKIMRANVGGMSSVTCRSIYTELKVQFGELSDSARQALKWTIKSPLNLCLTLQANLTNMLSANTCLKSHNVGYRDWELFDFAYEKLIHNERTREIALRYKTDSTFSHRRFPSRTSQSSCNHNMTLPNQPSRKVQLRLLSTATQSPLPSILSRSLPLPRKILPMIRILLLP